MKKFGKKSSKRGKKKYNGKGKGKKRGKGVSLPTYRMQRGGGRL